MHFNLLLSITNKMITFYENYWNYFFHSYRSFKNFFNLNDLDAMIWSFFILRYIILSIAAENDKDHTLEGGNKHAQK